MLKNLKDVVKNKGFINSVKKAELNKIIKYGGRTFKKVPDFACFRCYNCIFEDYDQCAKIDCLEDGDNSKTFHIEEIIE